MAYAGKRKLCLCHILDLPKLFQIQRNANLSLVLKRSRYLFSSCLPLDKYSTTAWQLSCATWNKRIRSWKKGVAGKCSKLESLIDSSIFPIPVVNHSDNSFLTSLCCSISASSWVSFNLRTWTRTH